MSVSQPNTATKDDLKEQFKAGVNKPDNKFDEGNMDDLMKFIEEESNSQVNESFNNYSPLKNSFGIEKQGESKEQGDNQNGRETIEDYVSLNSIPRNDFQEENTDQYNQFASQIRNKELAQSKLEFELQEKNADLNNQLAVQIREKELAQSNLESVTKELNTKEKNLKRLRDGVLLKDVEFQKLLETTESQKANNQKNKEDLLKQSKEVNLLTNKISDLQLQLTEKIQENQSIQHKYAVVIEEVTASENNVKKLRNEATLKDLEYKRLLENIEKDKRKIDAQNKDIQDLTERLAAQVQDKELIQYKLETVSQELQTLRYEILTKQEERKKLLESIERLGIEKKENQKNKEELARLTEKCKRQNKEIVDLRKTLNIQITFTTIVILSAVGIVGWNYFISQS